MVFKRHRPDTGEADLKNWLITAARLGLIGLLLSACDGGPAVKPSDTPAPEAVITFAAQTAEALRVERLLQTATLAPEAIIETSMFATPTQTPPSIQVSPSVAATTAAPAATQPASPGERGEYLADVTVPDGTVFFPNQQFQKTWRVKNTGQTTWTTDYALIYIDGDLMGAEPAVPLAEAVEPGNQTEITVDMVTPPNPGGYRGYWKLRNAAGQVFGFGLNGDEAIWVDIVVESGEAAINVTGTPAAARTISTISLSVDNAQVSGTCPHTFRFIARINLNKSATLIYALEVGSTSGASIHTPLPAQQNLGAGEHPVIYELSVPSDATAWARLRVTQPEEAFSNQVNFSLDCA